MSGGSWDYLYEKVECAARELQQSASPERRALGKRLAPFAKALHDIEWVDSCDYGPGDDIKAIREALGGEREMAAAVLAEMIDEAKNVRDKLDAAIRCASPTGEVRK